MSRWLALLLCVPWLAWAGASREWTENTADRLIVAVAPVTAVPMSESCWATLDAGSGTIFGISADSGSHWTRIRTIAAGDQASSRENSALKFAVCGAARTIGQWQLTTGMFILVDDRECQIDAGNEITNTNTVGPVTGQDQTTIGLTRRGGVFEDPHDGFIAHCGVWDVILTDAEIDELFAGMWTSWIATANLQGFWPVFGANNPETDLMNNTGDMTVTGTDTSVSGPPVFFPIGGM